MGNVGQVGGVNNNIGVILVLFILLVIIACSCGFFKGYPGNVAGVSQGYCGNVGGVNTGYPKGY